MKQTKPLIIFLLLVSSLAEAKKCEVGPIIRIIGNDTVRFAKSAVPCNQVNKFRQAINYAICAIYSDEFEQKLNDHIQHHIGTGKHVQAWEGVIAHDVVIRMRNQVNGTYISTYGGPYALWLNKVYGNLAYDGTDDGPIRFNEVPLKHRSAQSLSNTIAHEVAHRVGLSHPHSNEDLQIAYKEPPYVVGDIIEEIVQKMITDSSCE